MENNSFIQFCIITLLVPLITVLVGAIFNLLPDIISRKVKITIIIIAIILIIILFCVGVSLWTIDYMQQQYESSKQEMAATLNALPNRGQGNGWCLADSLATQFQYGRATVSFDATLPLQDFNASEYYIYFNENYVSGETLHLSLHDTIRNRFIFEIASDWLLTNPYWGKPELWTVTYQC